MQILGKAGDFQRAENDRPGRIREVHREERIDLAEGDEVTDIPVEADGIHRFLRRHVFQLAAGLQVLIQNIQIAARAADGGDQPEIALMLIHGKLIEKCAGHRRGAGIGHLSVLQSEFQQRGDVQIEAAVRNIIGYRHIQGRGAGVQIGAAAHHRAGSGMSRRLRGIQPGDHDILRFGGLWAKGDAFRRQGRSLAVGVQQRDVGGGLRPVDIVRHPVLRHQIQMVAHHAGRQVGSALTLGVEQNGFRAVGDVIDRSLYGGGRFVIERVGTDILIDGFTISQGIGRKRLLQNDQAVFRHIQLKGAVKIFVILFRHRDTGKLARLLLIGGDDAHRGA